MASPLLLLCVPSVLPSPACDLRSSLAPNSAGRCHAPAFAPIPNRFAPIPNTPRRAVSIALLGALVAPGAAMAEEGESPVPVYQNVAKEGEKGVRPVIFGVPAGLVYFAMAGTLQLSLLLKGKSGTTLQNGKVFQNGKRMAEPFTFSAEEAAKAAEQARWGGSNSTRGG